MNPFRDHVVESETMGPLSEGLEYVRCDLCESDDTREVGRFRDRNWSLQSGDYHGPADQRSWALVQCNCCGLVYLNPRPAALFLAEHYPTQYYAYEDRRCPSAPSRMDSLKAFVKRWLRRRRAMYSLARRFSSSGAFHDPIVDVIGFSKPGRVLDVGCGAGGHLDLLKELGWQTYGVEISERAAAVARGKGHEVWAGDITLACLPTRFFDVITMSHVLEHVPSPREVLRRVHDFLRPGGACIIDVPNWSSPWARALGGNNWNLDLPRHFYHFDVTTLTRLISDTGLVLQSCRSRATPRFLFWSTALQCLERPEASPGVATAEERWDVAVFLKNFNPQDSLGDFSRLLESRGWGNQLRAVVTRPV